MHTFTRHFSNQRCEASNTLSNHWTTDGWLVSTLQWDTQSAAAYTIPKLRDNSFVVAVNSLRIKKRPGRAV